MKRLLLVLAALASFAAPAVAQVIPPSQTISVQDSGTQCSVANTCAQWQLPNVAPSFTVQITGTLTNLSLTFRGSADGISFFDLLATKLSTGVQATTTTSTGQYSIVNPGIVALRVVGTTIVAGAANLTLTRGSASSSGRAFPSFGSFATGDLLYASAANVISGLADVAAGSYLRSGGVGVAPLWSTLVLPNAATTGDILAATSANTTGVIAAVATGQVLASAGTSTAPAYTANPSVTTVTTTRDNIVVTPTDALIATNTTAATSGVTVQMSPRLRWRGTAWDTAASQTIDFFAENLPATAATPTGTWKLGYSRNGGGATYPLTVSSAGVGTFLSAIVSGGSIFAPAASAFFVNGRSQMNSPADGDINFANNAGSGFTHLRIASDIIYVFTTPTITSGFSTSSPSIAGKSSAFAVTVGTPTVGTTTGLVTFGGATWTNVPSCSCTNTTTANLCQAVPTTTNVVLNGVWVASDILRVMCIGY